jgi:cob(I)alamin adenosyltransferase
MKTNHKILIIFVSTVMLSGCTVSRTTTNTFDDKGRVKIIKKFKVSKNIPVLKGLGTLAAVLAIGKTENGPSIANALLIHDIQNKTYKLQQERSEERKNKTANEKI